MPVYAVYQILARTMKKLQDQGVLDLLVRQVEATQTNLRADLSISLPDVDVGWRKATAMRRLTREQCRLIW